ncbi:hypothetical protein R1sor_016683 [Riccia sorocarpa]|uniref:Uncharacterized protein n=1 Tax=Riccia sorocarpa TaxID=122646 RepID=A0ABD3HJ11_9MARC
MAIIVSEGRLEPIYRPQCRSFKAYRLHSWSFEGYCSQAERWGLTELSTHFTYSSWFEPAGVAPAGPIADEADDENEDTEEGKDGTRIYWHDWKTVILLEVKKDIQVKRDAATSRQVVGVLPSGSGSVLPVDRCDIANPCSKRPNRGRSFRLNAGASPNYQRASPIPGRNEPLPDSSFSEREELDLIPVGSNPAGVAPAGPIADETDDENENTEEGKDGTRIYWHYWKTVILLEVKKDIQTIGKFTDFRKVRWWNNWSGKPFFWTMNASDRKKEKLPPKFPEQWFELVDIMQKARPVINLPCVESSSTPPGTTDGSNPSSPSLPVQGSVPVVEARSGAAAVEAESQSRNNSRHKRKKEASRSATLLVDALDRMSANNVAVIEKVEQAKVEREKAKNELAVQLEDKRQDRTDSRTQSMVQVLGGLVNVLGDLVASKRQKE